jgi:hypothetical protein
MKNLDKHNYIMTDDYIWNIEVLKIGAKMMQKLGERTRRNAA